MRKTLRVLFLLLTVVCVIGITPSAGWAQNQYALKELTPEVEKALDSRKQRFDQLQQGKQSGAIGESNRGYLIALEQSPQIQQLVEAENADRQTIYRAIERQNNLSGAMASIEQVFAQVQREKAQPGERLQLENGTWITQK